MTNANTVAAVISRRFLVPPSTAWSRNAATVAAITIVHGAYCPTTIQLLYWIAANSFSRVAAQNTGSEKKRNALNVTV